MSDSEPLKIIDFVVDDIDRSSFKLQRPSKPTGD